MSKGNPSTVYVVHAFRWGKVEEHNYLVAVYSHEEQAIKAAQLVEQNRGGKYYCTVDEVGVQRRVTKVGELLDEGYSKRVYGEQKHCSICKHDYISPECTYSGNHFDAGYDE